jgi:hypothetical protein
VRDRGSDPDLDTDGGARPARTRRRVEDVRRLSVAALNRHIVRTLKDADNPVTHSEIGAMSGAPSISPPLWPPWR